MKTKYEVFIRLTNCKINISLGTFTSKIEAEKVLNKAKQEYENFEDGWYEEVGL